MNARVKKENMEELLRRYWHDEIQPHIKAAVEIVENGDNMDMKTVRKLHQHLELAEAGVRRYRWELFDFYGNDEIFEEARKLLKAGNIAEARKLLGI